MKLLYKLERKFGKFAIRNLIGYIVFANVVVLILGYFSPGFINNLVFDPNLVLHGQVWRVVTFLFIPPKVSTFFLFFALYIDYLIGTSLEHEWGTFKFNCYYFLGVLGIIIGAFASGLSMDNYYLSLSLFLAFAKLYPEQQFTLFFVLPVKVKYLGWLSWAFFIFSFLTGSLTVKIAIGISVLNYFVFFGKDIISGRKNATKSHVRKKTYRTNSTIKKDHLHKCEVCGRTDEDDTDLEFRVCSKCEGQHEYCFEHLFGHEHIK
ncbi:MAG: hypothetical protein CVU84_00565 [Firmicutes bacterium HGW-Firmicutes-1]|jgi:hypothetical protein|nr:MAG: hypothetical protein CVU84_00565 [Firmicutes bacterium HGW-Firmicutes-1]